MIKLINSLLACKTSHFSWNIDTFSAFSSLIENLNGLKEAICYHKIESTASQLETTSLHLINKNYFNN